MRDTENKAKENSVRGLELTAEKINSYSAAEGAKALADLKKQSIHAMEENEAFLMKLLQDNKVSIPIKTSTFFGNSEHSFPEKQSIPFRNRVQFIF